MEKRKPPLHQTVEKEWPQDRTVLKNDALQSQKQAYHIQMESPFFCSGAGVQEYVITQLEHRLSRHQLPATSTQVDKP